MRDTGGAAPHTGRKQANTEPPANPANPGHRPVS